MRCDAEDADADTGLRLRTSGPWVTMLGREDADVGGDNVAPRLPKNAESDAESDVDECRLCEHYYVFRHCCHCCLIHLARMVLADEAESGWRHCLPHPTTKLHFHQSHLAASNVCDDAETGDCCGVSRHHRATSGPDPDYQSRRHPASWNVGGGADWDDCDNEYQRQRQHVQDARRHWRLRLLPYVLLRTFCRRRRDSCPSV